MDKIFENLEKQILKSPKNVKVYCKEAKEELEDLLSKKNYKVFENIMKELKPVVINE